MNRIYVGNENKRMKNKCGERWMNKQMDDKMDGRGG